MAQGKEGHPLHVPLCFSARSHPFCDEDIYSFSQYSLRNEGVGISVVDRCYAKPWGYRY